MNPNVEESLRMAAHHLIMQHAEGVLDFLNGCGAEDQAARSLAVIAAVHRLARACGTRTPRFGSARYAASRLGDDKLPPRHTGTAVELYPLFEQHADFVFDFLNGRGSEDQAQGSLCAIAALHRVADGCGAYTPQFGDAHTAVDRNDR